MIKAVERSPEFEILIRCCRAQAAVAKQVRLSAVIDIGVRWDALLALARRHGMLPQLRRSLRGPAWRMVPAEPAAALRSAYRTNLVRCLDLMRELARLLEMLGSAGVRAVTLKGPVLSVQAFGDPAARVFHDLDLLIEAPDLPGAVRQLGRAGYVPEVAMGHRDAASFVRQESCLGLRHRRSGQAVELHWNYLPMCFRHPVDFAALWRDRRTIAVAGRRFAVLPDRENARFLCLHGFKHGWDRLSLACDLAGYLSGTPVISLAVDRPVAAGMLLVESLVPGTIDAACAAACHADATAERLARGWERRLGGDGPDRMTIMAATMGYAAAQQGWRRRLVFLWRLLFTATVEDWKFWKCGKPYRLYTLLRPVRLLAYHLLGRRSLESVDALH